MIKVMLDTNIIVSAFLNNRGVPHQAYQKAVEPPYQCSICEQTLEELRRVFIRKFPGKIQAFESFLAVMLPIMEVVPVPPSPSPDETEIRDVNDRPIYRAALSANVDILVTGDKDFLESGLECPTIITATEFIQAY